MNDALMHRIKAHRSAPTVYDPPTFDQMADCVEQLEAKLSKVVNAAKAYRIATKHLRPCPETSDVLDTVLAELEGNK